MISWQIEMSSKHENTSENKHVSHCNILIVGTIFIMARPHALNCRSAVSYASWVTGPLMQSFITILNYPQSLVAM